MPIRLYDEGANTNLTQRELAQHILLALPREYGDVVALYAALTELGQMPDTDDSPIELAEAKVSLSTLAWLVRKLAHQLDATQAQANAYIEANAGLEQDVAGLEAKVRAQDSQYASLLASHTYWQQQYVEANALSEQLAKQLANDQAMHQKDAAELARLQKWAGDY